MSSLINDRNQSCVIKAAIGFEGPFNLKMLSSNLGLGTDTYGLSFIVRDLLDGHFITKSGDCKHPLSYNLSGRA